MRPLLPLAFAIGLCGCPEPKAGPEPAEAPLNLDKPDQARIQLDLAAVRAEVLKRQQMSGSYPASIDELGLKLFHPEDLEYDASNGTVKSRTYPMY
jgi:hypothetical protein